MKSVTIQQNTQSGMHWKDIAIKNAGGIADAWEVFIAYGAQLAAWILFFCMVCNIIQMLPHVTLPTTVVNLVMGVQIVTLDIAGFGLNTLAKHVHKHGDQDIKEVAKGAKGLAKFLIGVMIITLLLIAIGWLFPAVKDITDLLNEVLILGRVILTVIYMHTMHDLREAQSQTQSVIVQAQQEKSELLQHFDHLMHYMDQRVQQIEEAAFSAQPAISEAHLVGLMDERFQSFFTGWNEQNTQVDLRISQLFDLLKSPVNEERNTDEIGAIIEQEIPAELLPENTLENTPQICADINPSKAEKILEKKADNWDEVIAKFPAVIEWQSAGLRSVSVDQIIEATNFTKNKIARAKLPQTRSGNKRMESVLNWLAKEPVKKEVKKSRNTQPLTADIPELKSRTTIKLSVADLPVEMTA